MPPPQGLISWWFVCKRSFSARFLFGEHRGPTKMFKGFTPSDVSGQNQALCANFLGMIGMMMWRESMGLDVLVRFSKKRNRDGRMEYNGMVGRVIGMFLNLETRQYIYSTYIYIYLEPKT